MKITQLAGFGLEGVTELLEKDAKKKQKTWSHDYIRSQWERVGQYKRWILCRSWKWMLQNLNSQKHAIEVACMYFSDDREKEDAWKWTIGSECFHSATSNSKTRLINFITYEDSKHYVFS